MRSVKENSTAGQTTAPHHSNCALIFGQGELPYSLRAFLVRGPDRDEAATHVMVLVERVTEEHAINLRKAKTAFGLSDRELDIVTLVAQGLCNKEIATRLFISDHTVKDHLKNISRKMLTASRTEIIARLK